MNGKFNLKLIKDAGHATAVVTAVVVMILFCSSFFSLVYQDCLDRWGYDAKQKKQKSAMLQAIATVVFNEFAQ